MDRDGKSRDWYGDGDDHEYDYERIERSVRNTPPEDVAKLSDRCDDILDAHATIQKEHHDQAIRLFRIYAIGLGLILAVGGFAVQRITAVPFSSIEATSLDAVLTAVVLLTLLALGLRISVPAVVRFVGTVELIGRVLTPDQISDDSRLSRYFEILSYFGHEGEAIPKNEPDFQIQESRETVRRVVEVDHLIDRAKRPTEFEPKNITERLARARENEYVLNYNVAQLSRVYGSIIRSLIEVTVGVILLITAAIGFQILAEPATAVMTTLLWS